MPERSDGMPAIITEPKYQTQQQCIPSLEKKVCIPSCLHPPTRVRTGPVLGFGPAGFLWTRTGTGPFLDRRRSIFLNRRHLLTVVTNSKYEYCDARHT